MTADTRRYNRIKELALVARELKGKERAEFLARELAGDDALRREVESLLTHDSAPLRAESAVGRVGGRFAVEDKAPDAIGPYRVLRELGRGGMGVVYEAEQTEPIRRRVAVKRLRGELFSDRQIARFDAERQTLALMEHPGIATIHDAGTDDTGRPYVVMELVDGEPITEYCIRRNLDVPQRIELFRDVCDAVQHAHQRGVMHRDLKPSNVLVTEQGGSARPKVIDFGIAREIEVDTQGGFTAAGELVGTPGFMSPEQAGGRPELLDSRTDIYSLGVILYELLTGVQPFPPERFREASLAETLRIIQEEEPSRPSSRVMIAGGADPVRSLRDLRRRLKTDLDWVVLRAMAKDPEDRYASAAALSADLLRHLEFQPLDAGPPSARYRITKFVRRNRIAVAGAAALLVALVAGVAGTSWQAVQASRERARAEKQLENLRTLANQFVFGVHDQVQNLHGATPVREYIVGNAAVMLDEIAQDARGAGAVWVPLIGAYTRLGNAQMDLGRTDEGHASLERAIAVAQEILAAEPGNREATRLLAVAHDQLGRSWNTQGKIELALEQHEVAVSLLAPLAADHPDSAEYANLSHARQNCGFNLVRMGRSEEALVEYDEAIRLRETLLEDNPDSEQTRISVATMYAFRAEALGDLGRGEEALAAFRRSTEVFEKGWKADPSNTLFLNRLAVTLGAVGWQLGELGRHDEAVAEMERSVELRRELCDLNPEHMVSRRDLGKGYLQLGDAYAAVGRNDDAITAYDTGREICAILTQEDPTDRHSARYLANLCQSAAFAYLETGRYDEALAVIDEGHAINERLLANEPGREDHHYRRATSFYLRGLAHERQAGSRRAARKGDPSIPEEWTRAREWYGESLAVLLAMEQDGILPAYRSSEIESRRTDIARCDAALESLSTP